MWTHFKVTFLLRFLEHIAPGKMVVSIVYKVIRLQNIMQMAFWSSN